MRTRKIKFTLISLILLFLGANAGAQTSVFLYQGKLNDNNNPANGNYEMQFKLFDALAGGTQIGATQTNVVIPVTNGIFSVTLDFGASAFTGANRFLEVAVRRNASESFVILTPRTQILTAPYSIRSGSASVADTATNAAQLGGLAASEYLTNSSAGNSFIRNATNLQTANFNINGNGFFGGNLGIGTTNPLSKVMAQTPNFTYGFTHTNGTATVGTYLDFSGGWLGTRSNHPLHFFTNGGLQQATLAQNGFFGIGTVAPTAKLTVSGSGVFNAASAARFDIFNTVSGNGFLQNVTDAGLFQIATTGGSTLMVINQQGNVGIGTTTPNNKLFVEGGMGQSAASYGLPKFMLLIRNNGLNPATIERCYNAVGGTSTVPCGILSINQPGGAGPINIRFPFRVTDRFFSMTLINASATPHSFSVVGFDAGDLSGQTMSVLAQSDEDFYLIVF